MRTKDIKMIQRRCGDKAMTKAMVRAIKDGIRYRITKSGIVFYGRDGKTAGAHFTASDRRAALNLRADLQRLGYEMPREK